MGIGCHGGSSWNIYRLDLNSACRLCQEFFLGSEFSEIFRYPPTIFDAFQDEDAAVSEVEFRGLPRLVGALAQELEGVSIRLFVFVVGDPNPTSYDLSG